MNSIQKYLLSVLIFTILIIFGNKLDPINKTANLTGIIKNNNCISNWQCDSWTACNIHNESTRVCKDLNNCKNTLSPKTFIQCKLTPEVLKLYQAEYEEKLLAINNTSKIKIDFTRGIPEQNDENCQNINNSLSSCYYFNLPNNINIKFKNTNGGEIILENEGASKLIMDLIGPIGEPIDISSSGFYIYPTNFKNIFYIIGGKKIKNNIMSWMEMYLDISKKEIVFYADAGVELNNTRKSFVNIKKGSTKEHNINIILPEKCFAGKIYKFNSISINDKNYDIFPNSLELICNQDGQSYSDYIEVEPLALSEDFKTLHLLVVKNHNEIKWHFLFNLINGDIKFSPYN